MHDEAPGENFPVAIYLVPRVLKNQVDGGEPYVRGSLHDIVFEVEQAERGGNAVKSLTILG
jgi:hypothetical protein